MKDPVSEFKSRRRSASVNVSKRGWVRAWRKKAPIQTLASALKVLYIFYAKEGKISTTNHEKDSKCNLFHSLFLAFGIDCRVSPLIYSAFYVSLETGEYRTTMELADTRSSLSLDRDLHTFGVFNSDKSLVFQNYASLSSDSSSGYLQDAISEWVSPFKRRRMLFYPSDQPFDDTDKFLESCWNFDPLGDSLTGFNALSEDSLDSSIISIINGTTPPSSSTVKTEEEATPEQGSLSTPSSTSKSLLSNDAEISPPSEQGSSGSPEQRRKRLAYPFALVKPGATEEVLTLEEINARILRRPTRPVRHPIGEFACSPCVSPNGTGLSGKSVVAFTRVHTEGKGTITIIRTRG